MIRLSLTDSLALLVIVEVALGCLIGATLRRGGRS